jgi:hypothetical protein
MTSVSARLLDAKARNYPRPMRSALSHRFAALEREILAVANELNELDAALAQSIEDAGSVDGLVARIRAVEARLSEIEKELGLLRSQS